MIRIAVMVAAVWGTGVGRRRGAIPVPNEFAAAAGLGIGSGFGGGTSFRGAMFACGGETEKSPLSSCEVSAERDAPNPGTPSEGGSGDGIGLRKGK
jgi:hypothetical protein